MIDETEAKTIMCPFSKDFGAEVTTCLGRGCMAWNRGRRFKEYASIYERLTKEEREELNVKDQYPRPERVREISAALRAEGFEPLGGNTLFAASVQWGRELIHTGECMKAKK
jgi:hypothetical protein